MKDDLWKVLGEINESIRIAETKALAITGTSGIIIGFLFSKIELVSEASFSVVENFVLLLSTISFIVSVLASFFCLKPRFKIKSPKSLLFFKTINFVDHSEYLQTLEKLHLQNDSIELQISERIVAKSKIAQKKYNAINIGIYAFLIFVILLSALLFTSF